MKQILTLFFCLSHLLGLSQDQIHLEGRVLSKTDSTPIFNAHIFLKNTRLGTSTNEQGYFQFNYSDKYKEKSLLISCIGYSPEIIKETEKDKVIFLEEDVLALKEIVVTAIDPVKILETALESFKMNYYRGDINKTIYYNENILKNGQPLRKLEIIANVGSKGFERNHKNPSVFINQKRPIFNNDKTFDGANGIEVLYSLSWTRNYLRKSVIKKHDVSFIGKASFLDHDVYRIDLTKPERPNLITSIYITQKEHAIIAIKESFETNKQTGEEKSGSELYFIESIQYVDFTQTTSGKWHVNSIDDFRISSNDDTITEIRRYIKVLSVSETKLKTDLSPVDKETDLYDYESSYSKQFWSNFNAPPALKGNFE
ncbi:carboxypeptidase-like regulatory domain-containing protein [Marivirga sp.]|uniref:carboxypeptidase-like regulatory domain-containing protein n=1 Tax=Marivirga sp. TaxID=2018662 RepID=UPI0025FB7569|nr:carboxypeptidase-like regulatory domain-containing protein [Marivirga sp.]